MDIALDQVVRCPRQLVLVVTLHSVMLKVVRLGLGRVIDRSCGKFYIIYYEV